MTHAPTSAGSGRSTATACSKRGSRRAAPTRSGSTSKPWASRSWATRSTAAAGDELGLRRQFLHARRIAFAHPESGAPIVVESELPPDLDAVVRALARAPSERDDRRGPLLSAKFRQPIPPDARRPVDGAASRAVPPGSRRFSPPNRIRSHRARHHEAVAGVRSALRTPDPPLESQDEALHLRRARRHLHHRPRADPGAARRGRRLRPRTSAPAAAP